MVSGAQLAYFFSQVFNTSFPCPPTCLSTSLPSLKIIRHGMALMPKRLESAGASSTLTFTTFTLLLNSLASSSTIGLTWRHGPHHGAQKSTSTTPFERSTSCRKFAALPFTTAPVAATLAGAGVTTFFFGSSRVFSGAVSNAAAACAGGWSSRSISGGNFGGLTDTLLYFVSSDGVSSTSSGDSEPGSTSVS